MGRITPALHVPVARIRTAGQWPVISGTPDLAPTVDDRLVQRRLQPAERDAKGFFAGGDKGLLVGLLLSHKLKGERAVRPVQLADREASRDTGAAAAARGIAGNAIGKHGTSSQTTPICY